MVLTLRQGSSRRAGRNPAGEQVSQKPREEVSEEHGATQLSERRAVHPTAISNTSGRPANSGLCGVAGTAAKWPWLRSGKRDE